MFHNRIAGIFGVDKYDAYHELSCVRGDIEGHGDQPGMKALLSKYLGPHSFDPNDITDIPGYCNSQNLRKAVNDTIDKIKGSGKDSDSALLFLYFSGHGASIEGEPPEDQFLIATSDTEGESPQRGLRFSSVLEQLNDLKAAVVCCIGCCFGGNAITYIRDKQNIAIFASCSPNEESYFTGGPESKSLYANSY